MENKKGFVFGILGIIYLTFIIAILVLLIILGFKINESLIAFWEFLTTWWWAIGLTIFGLLYHKLIINIVRAILLKFGVRV